MRQSTLKARRGRGFSLMEMLMVIVIIATLLAIGLVAGANFRRDARVKQVKTVLDTCRAAATEYQAATGLVVNHSAYNPGDGSTNKIKPFDWKALADDDVQLAPLSEKQEQNDDPDKADKATNVYIERFVWAVHQVPSARKILEGHKFLEDTDADGFAEVVDPFGRALAYAAFVNHEDEIEKDDYLPEHRTPFFASRGIDGLWGQARFEEEFESAAKYADYLADPDMHADEAKDNIYSISSE